MPGPRGFSSSFNRWRKPYGVKAKNGVNAHNSVRIGYDAHCGAGVYVSPGAKHLARCDGCNMVAHPDTWRENGWLRKVRKPMRDSVDFAPF